MDRRVVIQESITTTNESNEIVVTGWQNITDNHTPWAKVTEVTGGEPIQADQVTPVKTTHFVLRYRTDITDQNRVIDDGEIYNILTILKIGRKGFLKLVAQSGGHYQETVT